MRKVTVHAYLPRPLTPQSLAGTPGGLAVEIACIGVLLALGWSDLTTPINVTVSAVGVFPVLIAAWFLSRRAVVEVALVAVGLQALLYRVGSIDLITTVADTAAILLMGVIGRFAAGSWTAIEAALRRLELLQNENSRQRQQASIAELGRLALVGTPPQQLMDHAVALVASTLKADYVRILELLPDGRNLLLRAGTGWRPGLVGTATVPLENSQVGYLFERSEPLIIEDLEAETRFDASWLLLEHFARSGVRVVIHGAPSPFGELSAYTREHRLFTEEDVLFLTATANTLAESFSRLHAELEKEQSLRQLKEADEARQLLLERLSLVVEEERKRIASDIHDDTLQILAGLGIRLQLLAEGLGDSGKKQSLRDLSTALAEAGRRLRRLIFDLRPDVLELGLGPALRFYFEQTATGMDPELVIDSHLSEELPEETRLMVYRACQEALNNVRKHARASRVTILVEEVEDGIGVQIHDDGVGFVVPRVSSPGHLGLVAMKERIQIAEGRFSMTSKLGQGTTVQFWVPLPKAGLSTVAPMSS
jgi:signal transduction histidine kinase